MIISAGGNHELGELLEKTSKKKPAKADLVKLQTYLAEHPDHAMDVGNIARQMKITILMRAFKDYEGYEMTVAANCRGMMDELGYADAGILEQMLIDHIIVTWLRMYETEMRYENVQAASVTLTQALYWEKKLSSNQRRYLRAMEALVKVRRLLRPEPSPALALLMKQQVIGTIQNNIGR